MTAPVPTATRQWVVRLCLGPLAVQSWFDNRDEAEAYFRDEVDGDQPPEAAAVIEVAETVVAAMGPLARVADPATFSVPAAAPRPEPEVAAETRRLRDFVDAIAASCRAEQRRWMED